MLVQELLEGELQEELLSYGIDPEKGRMSDEQYDTAMRELANRQAAAAGDTGPETAEKVRGLREMLAWHLHKVGSCLEPKTSDVTGIHDRRLLQGIICILTCIILLLFQPQATVWEALIS